MRLNTTVLLPHAGRRPLQTEHPASFTLFPWDVSAGETRYGEALSLFWGLRRTFLVVEHDNRLTESQLWELAFCPHEWCSIGYRYPTMPNLVHGLGAVKFGSGLLEVTAGDLDLVRSWRTLADYVERALTRRGFHRHEHPGEAEHDHPEPGYAHLQEAIPCPYVWDRGDRVYYDCRHSLGHAGPHEPIHAPPGFVTRSYAWFLGEEVGRV